MASEPAKVLPKTWSGRGLIWATAIGFVLVFAWAQLGLKFYQEVIPFYDSLSYQDGYDTVAQQAQEHGVGPTLCAVWQQPGNNVVLYKFAAAMLGPLIPRATVGLYVYLLGIHFTALLTLFVVVRKNVGSPTFGIIAVAAWLAAVPFSRLRDGVADQRMDLTAASFCLLVAALALGWVRGRSKRWAFFVGLAAALAVLHRPVMAPTIVAVVVVFVVRAMLLRQERTLADWSREAAWMILPGLILAVPWLTAHASELYRYYFVSNVDVGNALSSRIAASYNFVHFAKAIGPTYVSIVLGAFGWLIFRRRVDWADFAAVCVVTLVPLVILALSKSMGNVYVSQVGLGLPALVIACARPLSQQPLPDGRENLRIGLAILLLAGVAGISIHTLSNELRSLRPNARKEVENIVQGAAGKQHRPLRLASFQDYPVNGVAMVRVSREIGEFLQIGTYAYHPSEFGLPNNPTEKVADDEVRQAAQNVVRRMIADDDVLLLPSLETQNLLLPQPFSHRVIPEIRRAIAGNPHFQLEERVGPVDRMWFDLYRIRRP